MYHVVMASDNNYAQHLGVALVSLFENNKDLSIKVWIFEPGIHAQEVENLRSIASYYGQSIEFVHIDIADFEEFPVNSYYSPVTWFRLRLGQYIDKDVERILYLDCDTIVCGSLKELLDLDLCGNAIGAVKDTPWQLAEASAYLWHDSNTREYFNAGVLLIDMNGFREADVFNRAIDVLRSGQKLPFLDQDILNLVFESNWHQLPCKWNLLNGFLKREYQDGSARASEMREGIKSRVIIHYSAWQKPWMWMCENPLKKEYLKYLRLSPWKDYKVRLSPYERLVFVKRYLHSLIKPSFIRL